MSNEQLERRWFEPPLARRPHDQQTLGWVLVMAITCMLAVSLWSRLRQVDFEGAAPRPAPFLVDVNHAAWPELALLPGIGETIARRIVATREAQGPFHRLDDLARVRGLGPKTRAGLAPFVIFRPEASVKPPP